MTAELIKQKLTENGLKSTHQRLVVFQALINSKTHPSAEEIFDVVRINNPTISMGTVYKTLETFVIKELIIKVSTPGGKSRYDTNTGRHNHIYCTNTGEIIDFIDEELNEIIEDYIKKRSIENLNIKDIRLHIRGEKKDINKKVTVSNNF